MKEKAKNLDWYLWTASLLTFGLSFAFRTVKGYLIIASGLLGIAALIAFRLAGSHDPPDER